MRREIPPSAYKKREATLREVFQNLATFYVERKQETEDKVHVFLLETKDTESIRRGNRDVILMN